MQQPSVCIFSYPLYSKVDFSDYNPWYIIGYCSAKKFNLLCLVQEFAVAEDLRICTVKYADDLERRFCFEVVTPVRSCMLQADSDALRKKWVAYLEAGIARALRISASNKVCEIAPYSDVVLSHAVFQICPSRRVKI